MLSPPGTWLFLMRLGDPLSKCLASRTISMNAISLLTLEGYIHIDGSLLALLQWGFGRIASAAYSIDTGSK